MQICHSALRLSITIGLLVLTVVESYGGGYPSYLFYSSPSTSSIHKARILTALEQSRNEHMSFSRLVGAENVKKPRGIAVDSFRKVLYVVDSDSTRCLYAARIYFNHNGNIALEQAVKIVDNLASDWVAVDSSGNLFFAAFNQLWTLSATAASDRISAGSTSADDLTPKESPEGQTKTFELLYDGGNVKGVNTPQGIAVDGYHLFWANGQNGQQDGSVVQGLENPDGSSEVTTLSTNLATAHGVCLSAVRIFYTDAEQKVYSTKLNGGAVTTVTDKLQKPRGCAFDGDGTIFIADNEANKIVSFSGSGINLGGRRLALVTDKAKEPFGVAVYHGDHNHAFRCVSSLAVLVAIAVTRAFAFSE